jgi:hypothetical protein
MSVLREIDWLQGAIAASRANRACRASHACCAPKPASRAQAACARRRAISSRPGPSRRPTPPPRSELTGGSKTACTGCSTSPSATTSPGCAKATAPATWPPSRHFALNLVRAATTDDPSSHAEKSQDGQPATSKASCHPPPCDLDSEPWVSNNSTRRFRSDVRQVQQNGDGCGCGCACGERGGVVHRRSHAAWRSASFLSSRRESMLR